MAQTSTARKFTSTATRITRKPAGIREENLEKPATRRQRFALMCAFRRVGRNENPWEMELTMGDAHALLTKLNSGQTYEAPVRQKVKKMSLREELISHIKERMPELVGALRATMGIQSVVQNDTSMVKDDGKRYLFLGTGCSIVYLKYDGRSKKAKEIDEIAHSIRRDVISAVLSNFDSKTRRYYAEHGTPLEAVMFQDMNCNQTYWSIVQSFMTKKGAKNVRVHAYYD